MRTLIALICLLLGFASTSAFGQAVIANPGSFVRWDYPTPQPTSLVRFEVQYDTGTFTGVGIPASFSDATTKAGNVSYQSAIPSLTVGSHAVSVRACDATTCYAASSPPLVFTYVVPLTAPTNVGIIK